MKALAVFIIVALASLCDLSRGQGKVLNGAAAIVNKKAVTVQEAYVYRALQRINNRLEPVVLEEEGEELKRTVQKIVFEEMVLAEMKNIQKEINVQAEVAQWFKEKKERGKSLEIIKKKYSLTDEDIAQKLARTFSAEKFIQLKIETVTPGITEDEVQKYFKRNEAQYRGRSFEDVKPNIVIFLKKQAVQRSLEEWIRSLKDKYEVTMLLDS
jgi:hypothetical protein